MCIGFQVFAFVVVDFDMLSAVTMCPIMAGKHSVNFRLLNEFFFLDVSEVVGDNVYGSTCQASRADLAVWSDCLLSSLMSHLSPHPTLSID